MTNCIWEFCNEFRCFIYLFFDRYFDCLFCRGWAELVFVSFFRLFSCFFILDSSLPHCFVCCS